MQQTVDIAGITTDDATKDILDIGIGKKVSNLPFTQTKLLETVEEIRAISGELSAMNLNAIALWSHHRPRAIVRGGN